MQQHQKHHDCHPVVEQGLTADFGFQAFRHPGFFQDAEHGDRVGGGDQRAEQQAVHQRQPDVQPVQYEPGQGSDDKRRTDRSHGGQRADDPLLVCQAVQVDVQCPGKQQKAQHAVQKGLIKIDAVDQSQRIFLQAESQRTQQCDPQRSHKRDGHHPDGSGQLDETVVDVAEHGRKRDQDGQDVEQFHKFQPCR